jgi:hypothetical protein
MSIRNDLFAKLAVSAHAQKESGVFDRDLRVLKILDLARRFDSVLPLPYS